METDLKNEILKALATSSEPLLAREIADKLSQSSGEVIDRSVVNQLLYGDLRSQVIRNEAFKWSPSADTSAGEPVERETHSSNPGFGLNFPVVDTLRERIKDAVTLSRAGQRWSAALLISDPVTNQAIVNLYTWELIGGQWKTRETFAIRSKKAATHLREILTNVEDRFP